jgi:hypothetical protein
MTLGDTWRRLAVELDDGLPDRAAVARADCARTTPERPSQAERIEDFRAIPWTSARGGRSAAS